MLPQQPADTGELPRARTLIVACGALVRELRSVLTTLDDTLVDVHYLPAPLHNRPEKITPAILDLLDSALTPEHGRVLLGYADCGTGGLLDAELERLRTGGLQVERLPGDHCYEFFTGQPSFAELHNDELGTFFLTDYLARHFDQIIWKTFKLDRHPELIAMLFGNYRRVVYLAQTDEPGQKLELTEKARDAADRLGLDFETRETGLGPFREALVTISAAETKTATEARPKEAI